jgi:GT2 family glycosyltransferase
MGLEDTGFIVIGRNEAGNLGDALAALPDEAAAVLYVDSGSADDSVQIATGMRYPVHALDDQQPFSAARARKEGVAWLLERHPEIRFIQFVDGDCLLCPEWVPAALDVLREEPAVGVICGVLSERYPDASWYNRFNAARWRALPLGDIAGSGGIFLARVEAYRAAGGFRAELLTGEEMDFCNRVRDAGYRVRRIPVAMAEHDSELLRFRDWWDRAVWGGRGDALQLELLGNRSDEEQRREFRSVMIWALLMPGLLLAGAALSFWDLRFLAMTGLALVGYAVLAARILWGQLRNGERWGDALLYSLLAVFRKLPYALGYLGQRRNGGIGAAI